MINSLLIQAKVILIDYLESLEEDQDAIEYFIDSIDYLLSDRIPLNTEVIRILLEDMLVTSTYHKNSKMLEVVGIFTELLRAIKCRA